MNETGILEAIEADAHHGDMLGALDKLLTMVARWPENAEGWHLLMICLEALEAREEVPEHCGWRSHDARSRVQSLDVAQARTTSLRIPHREFDQILVETINDLNDEIRSAIDQVAIRVEELPPPEIIFGADPIDPRLLGLFVGPTWADLRSGMSVTDQPSTIFVFQRNLERAFPEFGQLIEEIRTTFLHEIGHFLGYNDRELAAKGL